MKHSPFVLSLVFLVGAACSEAELVQPDRPDSGGDEDGGLTDVRVDAKSDARPPSPACKNATFRIRAIAANLSSGSGQSWDAGHGARILKGLVPDLVMMQEFNVGKSSAGEIASFVAATFGSEFTFVRGSGDIPNGVVSRYPIVDSGNWTDPQVANRAFTWARIDVPGAVDLFAVSVHLLTSGDRAGEASALIGEWKKAVPADALGLLGGDFNTKARNDGAIGIFSEKFVTAAPYPEGPGPAGSDLTNTNEPRSSPYDWVLANGDLDTHEVPVVIGKNSFPNGLVFDSAYYTPLSDVPPVQLGDSHATGMQHMAVVRDFDVPCQ